jgi:hypothetical protein
MKTRCKAFSGNRFVAELWRGTVFRSFATESVLDTGVRISLEAVWSSGLMCRVCLRDQTRPDGHQMRRWDDALTALHWWSTTRLPQKLKGALRPWATFGLKKNSNRWIILFSSFFDKYYPIVDQLGLKDSSRDFQLNYVISYFFYLHLLLHASVQRLMWWKESEKILIFGMHLNKALLRFFPKILHFITSDVWHMYRVLNIDKKK